MKRWETAPRGQQVGTPSPALTSPKASVVLRQLHGQAELQRQLGLPRRAASSQLCDAVQGQPATEQRIQHRAAQAQALVLLRERPLLPEQVQRWGRRRGKQVSPGPPCQGPSPAGTPPRPPTPHAGAPAPVHTPCPRRSEAAALSRSCTSGLERRVRLCRSGPERCRTSFTDLSLAEITEPVTGHGARGNSDSGTEGDSQLWGPGRPRLAHLLPEAARTPGRQVREEGACPQGGEQRPPDTSETGLRVHHQGGAAGGDPDERPLRPPADSQGVKR